MTLSPETLAELERLLAADTSHAWVAVPSDSRKCMSWIREEGMPQGADSIALVGASEVDDEANRVELIAALKNHAPALIARIRELEEGLRRANGKIEQQQEALALCNKQRLAAHAKAGSKHARALLTQDQEQSK